MEYFLPESSLLLTVNIEANVYFYTWVDSHLSIEGGVENKNTTVEKGRVLQPEPLEPV